MSDILYTKAHSWARTEGEELLIGVTQYAAERMGDIIFVELPDVGADLQAGQVYGSIESAKAVEDLVSPVTGQVVRVNEALLDAPETMNEDPSGAGWTVAVAATSAELGETMDEAAYQTYLASLD
ncbi:MAG: glycine cleavage system protein GcvH [candidate division WS1 bacterium]|jgi:glycine cleavage system H protein|nr:glycine cleavage system protein GcvH [candidate division WS1 bacterium]